MSNFSLLNVRSKCEMRLGGGSHQPAYVIYVGKFGENKYHPGGTMVYLELLETFRLPWP